MCDVEVAVFAENLADGATVIDGSWHLGRFDGGAKSLTHQADTQQSDPAESSSRRRLDDSGLQGKTYRMFPALAAV